MKARLLQEPVRVDFHLDHGYTRVILERTVGMGLADGGISWDIPTNSIPQELRRIGSRFLISIPCVSSSESDSIESIRAGYTSSCIDRLE